MLHLLAPGLLLSAAADEVRTSMCLKVVLEYTLALGNYLNGTSNKGAAWGFKLETLNKLQGTKSTDNKTTLLHYLARLYEAEAAKASDPETFSLSATMPNLEMAARTVWKDDGAELAFGRCATLAPPAPCPRRSTAPRGCYVWAWASWTRRSPRVRCRARAPRSQCR